ncbi:MAG: BMP family ABC transporter substrate-binding protein [Bacillus sp. (in: Bacteria)]|nr:BMP family ABC transporter substrate-binding protein [Bacillus sp. (in: firmicutes)]
MKYFIRLSLAFLFILLNTGCSTPSEGKLEKAGLLLSDPIDDQGWNSMAYQGILNVQSNLGIQVYVKEDIKTEQQVAEAIEQFHLEGVNLVFGHSFIYADHFMQIKDKYPEMYFVSFNGAVDGKNITSLHFEGYAMGYFAGMLASEMTETKVLGVIAAFDFQPEVQGFVDGATLNNPEVEVLVDFVHNWVDTTRALVIFEEMKDAGVDIFYPAGDGYHVSVVQEAKKAGLYAIGYVRDQSDLGENTILTSTVQHVEKLYEYVAEAYDSGTLEEGNKYYDFAEGVISLGTFSSEVPPSLKAKVEAMIKDYIETGVLPHEQSN